MLATVDEDPFGAQPQGNTLTASPAARWAPTTRSPGARTTRAAARSTPALGDTPRASTPSLTTHLEGAISGPPGRADPVYSDCGATVLANYQQVKVSAPPNLSEPIGFDVLPDGRVMQTDRARRRAPARSRRAARSRDASRNDPGLHRQRGRPLRPGDRQRLRHEPLGLPLLRAADGRRTSSCRTARRHADDAEHARRRTRPPSTERVGSVRRLLPAVAVQVRRRRSGRPAHLDLGVRAEDPAGLQQPRRVLPRGGRHRLRQAQQPVAGHRRRHARPAAATRVASRRSTT